MWKAFLTAALFASYRPWQQDSAIAAGTALFAALMVFWSAGVIDNYARASGDYTNSNSMAEAVVIAVNFLFSVASIGLLAYSFF